MVKLDPVYAVAILTKGKIEYAETKNYDVNVVRAAKIFSTEAKAKKFRDRFRCETHFIVQLERIILK